MSAYSHGITVYLFWPMLEKWTVSALVFLVGLFGTNNTILRTTVLAANTQPIPPRALSSVVASPLLV